MHPYMNSHLESLPHHLKQYMVGQHYEHYTPVNHAVWRYVMRLNRDYLPTVAHPSYLKGLAKTGITIEKIPDMVQMNEILGQIGWAACTVDGFINPQAFMEFQKYQVLVVAADIRQLNHIQYTPAPDIIHEAAGHAPIIADPDYAEYLRLFGEIGSRAFSSAKDIELFEAIRYLSIIKENPNTKQDEIELWEAKIAEISANMGEPSEMSLIRRLHWWTVEYGLVGSLEKPMIYGAGLLSSIGESYSCMKPEVKKRPYDLDAVNIDFDITKPQPQLFVTPDFRHLTRVLEAFAEQMALRKGGAEGLAKAKHSGAVATVRYSSGLQATGVVADFIEDQGQPVFLRFGSPTALAFNDKQLDGHGTDYHAHGFSSPVGRLLGSHQALEDMDADSLRAAEIVPGQECQLRFESGLTVRGRLAGQTRRPDGGLLLLSFADCTVEYQGRRLFLPEWGTYDMAVGQAIDSVYAGAADPDAYGYRAELSPNKTLKIEYSETARQRHALYAEVAQIRETKSGFDRLEGLAMQVRALFADDWLLNLQCYELLHNFGHEPEAAARIRAFLLSQREAFPQNAKLIDDGLRLAEKEPLGLYFN